ncbi:VQ motif-containing protein 4-like [Musa acuminata AAA Group]|uniref:VQ motif-containing protein 4-like n=1 Tax=Musa acuminata AAA Group TaxID=214697 RepID=UPI0031D1E84B
MENHHLHLQDREIQSAHPNSPHSTTSGSCISNNNGATAAAATAGLAPPPPPLTPKPLSRSTDSNPYPTTFIQADTSSFKQVVQMLTGSAETTAKHVASAAAPAKNPLSPPPVAKSATGPKKPAFKLYERRGSLKNLKMIGPLIPTLLGSNPSSPVGNGKPFSPSRNQMPEILSPSVLDFPSLALSPVTPLIPDPFNRPPHPNPAAGMSAEDRAIAEKGFYLHPSPRTTPRDAQPPRLLPLFPVTSPKMSSASAAAGSST